MRTILCIDDDPTFIDLYRAILERRGHKVVTAMNAAEGLDLTEKDCPDLILLDVMMPESGGFRDGFDLLERFRKTGNCRKTPIIMVSAIGGPDDAKHGLDLGADAYIAKNDLTPDILAKKIEEVLEKGR